MNDNDKAAWEAPEIEPLTDIDTRADQADISVRNLNGPIGSWVP
jgi:hypothetical protein